MAAPDTQSNEASSEHPEPTKKGPEEPEEYRAKAVLLSRGRSEHVTAIIGMMRRGDWVRGVTGPLYAAEHELSKDVVRSYSTEAWRHLSREVTDPTKVSQVISQRMAVAIDRAAEKGKFGDVARLADVWSRVVGARAPERHEVAMVVAEYDRLPKEGKLQWLNDRIAALTEARDALVGDDALLGDVVEATAP